MGGYMQLFNSWWFYVILYLFSNLIYNQFYKLCTKTVFKDSALAVLLEFMAGITILVFLPFYEFKFSTDIRIYIFFGLSIVFNAITDRISATVRRGVDVSTFNILKQLSTAFMIVAGVIFFKESIVVTKIIGAILIIFSNIFIFYKKGSFKIDKYVLLGMASNISYTIAMFLDVSISETFSLPIYIAAILIGPAILIFVFGRIKLVEIKNEFINGNKKFLFATSISWGLAALFGLRAYQLGDVSIVAPLRAISVLMNVIAGYTFLKEKDNLVKKIIAAILIVISIFLIKL